MRTYFNNRLLSVFEGPKITVIRLKFVAVPRTPTLFATLEGLFAWSQPAYWVNGCLLLLHHWRCNSAKVWDTHDGIVEDAHSGCIPRLLLSVTYALSWHSLGCKPWMHTSMVSFSYLCTHKHFQHSLHHPIFCICITVLSPVNLSNLSRPIIMTESLPDWLIWITVGG